MKRNPWNRKEGLTAFASGLCCVWIVLASSLCAEVKVKETSSSFEMENGIVHFVLSLRTGSIESLRLEGQELLGKSGVGYVDIDDSAHKHFNLGRHEPEQTRYRLRLDRDAEGRQYAEIRISHTGTVAEPLAITHFYLLREGESGIHMFTVVEHDPALPPDTFYQGRFVMKGDEKLFDHVSVEDDPLGRPWRTPDASLLPSPEDLKHARAVQDATFDLEGTGSAYPRRYYTKYDWSAYFLSHRVHGYYGHGYGAWICLPQGAESFNGGPFLQDLIVHQGTGPVLISRIQGTHFGARPVQVFGDFHKTYGPFFLFLTRGKDVASMRAEAEAHAAQAWDRRFYDALKIPGYLPSGERGTVQGKIHFSDGKVPTGALAILSDDGAEFSRTAQGFQYWTAILPDGSFVLPGVRPAKYRFSVYRPGVFGDFHRDGVQVEKGQNTLPTMECHLPDSVPLWRIGVPDRTAQEFRHGDEFRNYWGTFDYEKDFPSGVHFQVGRSQERTDWNYVQWANWKGTPLPPWTVEFTLREAPPAHSVLVLSIALASYRANGHPGQLVMQWNGEKKYGALPVEDSSGAAVRSGVSGVYTLFRFALDPKSLHSGKNTLTLSIAGSIHDIQYDALELTAEGPEEVLAWARRNAVPSESKP